MINHSKISVTAIDLRRLTTWITLKMCANFIAVSELIGTSLPKLCQQRIPRLGMWEANGSTMVQESREHIPHSSKQMKILSFLTSAAIVGCSYIFSGPAIAQSTIIRPNYGGGSYRVNTYDSSGRETGYGSLRRSGNGYRGTVTPHYSSQPASHQYKSGLKSYPVRFSR